MRCPTLTPKARSASLSCSAARPSPSHTCLARKRSRSTQERRIDVFVSRVRAFAPWPFAYTIYILHFAASCVATRDQQILIRHDSLRFSWYTAYRVYTASHGGAVLRSTRGGPGDISSPMLYPISRLDSRWGARRCCSRTLGTPSLESAKKRRHLSMDLRPHAKPSRNRTHDLTEHQLHLSAYSSVFGS